jgi:hypothetical protein
VYERRRAGRRLLPATQGRLQGLLHGRHVQVAHGAEFTRGGADKAAVEVLHLRHRDGAHVLLQLVKALRMAQVTARVGVAVARQPVGDHRIGLLALALDAGQPLAAHSSSGSAGKAGSRSNRPTRAITAGRCWRRVVMFAAQRSGRCCRSHFGLQLVQLIGDLLARQAGTALVQQAGGKAGHGLLAEEALLVAEAQRQPGVHDTAARALGSSATFRPPSLRELRARVQRGRRGVEGFGLRRRGVAAIVLHQGRHVHSLALRGALGLAVGW